MSDLERAIAFAAEAHAGQVDKLGEPYIDHCLRVMEAVSVPAKRVAVLHDVVEDTPHRLAEIAVALDLEQREVTALMRLTRGLDHTYGWYVKSIATMSGPGGVLAREVKVADLRDNLGRWVPELGEDLRKRYERALARLTEGEA